MDIMKHKVGLYKMLGGVFALVHAQASNLRIMEGIASDQMKMMVLVTLKVVQANY